MAWSPSLDELPLTCAICGGLLAHLGKLGNTDHFRCIACGAECGSVVEPEPEASTEPSPRMPWSNYLSVDEPIGSPAHEAALAAWVDKKPSEPTDEP